jgi:hypothetical protein
MFDENIVITDQDLTTVNFCNKMTSCISTQDLKQKIFDHLFQKCNIQMHCTNKYFRVFNEETDLALLKKYKHLAYINTNHKINLIVLAKFQNKPICLYIDKFTGSIYLLKCQFSSSLYEGTIFEGKLIETSTANYFMISDFLVYMKKKLSTVALDHRLNLLKSIFSPENYHPDATLEPFKMMIENFVEYSQLESYISDYIPTTPYKDQILGIIFRPVSHSNKNLIYHFNREKKTPNNTLNNTTNNTPNNTANNTTNNTTNNIKSPSSLLSISLVSSSITTKIEPVSSSNSSQGIKLTDLIHKKPTVTQKPDQVSAEKFRIDTEKYKEVKFMLFETGNPDDYILKLKNYDGQLFQYGYALINDMKTSQYFQKLLADLSLQEKKDGICVLCKYHPVFKKWKPFQAIIDQTPTNIVELN